MIPASPTPFRGVYAATLVPFLENGMLDEARFTQHLSDCTRPEGIVGILCNGHAGENHLLTREEKRRVVELAAETIGTDRIIVSGILSEDVDEACLHARDAVEAGADALLVFPPFSWAVSQDHDAIIAYHAAICEAVDTPIMLYQSSVGSGGMAYSLPILESLLRFPSIVAIKEGSWETNAYDKHRRLAARIAPHVDVMASGDEHLLPCFAIGTTGSLVSLAAILPVSLAKLWHAMENNDLPAARKVHDIIQPLANLIYGRAPSGRATLRLKACLVMQGKWPSCRTRKASDIIAQEEWQELSAALQDAMILEGP
ncbi:dihydrodipicolinate synthase [Gluconobacter thailandicus F149-1 = NBRC 100600]|uniref:Dihydrodipicolinate synthetase n=1 Tax=Gluconobacter thailandicus NBRC 3257 TaxID=1381097 RepID=A0ABQ0J0N7_GLUTH|nr:dihydrodipicolinate synthase family protein [Gluconobacter thailandicus]KXV54776.1 dihydrodipicolinate synthetase [Gluconobacter thailandicus]GAC89345.1 dihydrodipicolinate synthetase [Gluconobacter thailandicus NBRC 3255]GAD28012.1 dihydrodipicolinate synthetase [Gluconobacter thailandicus NBRC 3257]GAN94748.1 dihydrodipicolinate synthase [Gluconobacter thailandicus F149-1 = NBRC 100600]GBR58915.1 dihydrodipicolinate synthase [Gluconobacter thailandicus F149-1 = NBRC 100600]